MPAKLSKEKAVWRYRFPPHSKNAALLAVATDSRLSRVTARRLYHWIPQIKSFA
jgi:hypothetical protein